MMRNALTVLEEAANASVDRRSYSQTLIDCQLHWELGSCFRFVSSGVGSEVSCY